jgi:predicted NUDIX family phosphoesterase
MEEQILCLSSEYFDSIGRFQGYSQDTKYVTRLFNPRNKQFSFQPKNPETESNPFFKQIVSYVTVQFGQPEDRLILSYTRGSSGGEGRLHDFKSIGVGGHVNDSLEVPQKISSVFSNRSFELSYIKEHALREIKEEISYPSKNPNFYLIGLINDDSNPVGQVHLGVVYCLHLNTPEVESRESSLANLEIVSPHQVLSNKDQYEPWSQLLIDGLYN